MTVRNLGQLLAPRSVALIGASQRPGSVGATVARNLLDGGFGGSVWLINPKHAQIGGVPCYRDVAALPAVPDLAVVCTPAAAVPAVIAELSRAGTKAAIVITAPEPSSAGTGMEDAMRAITRETGLRCLGPNCLGLMVPAIGLNASFAHTAPLAGDLALISQSGAIVTAMLDWAKARGIGFSHLVSLGNMVDVDVDDLLDQFAAEPSVRAILLYIEGITDARSFISAARVAARAKPVIVLKAGRHPEAAKAAASHTGAMAGADAVYDAAFARTGLVRVGDLGELFEAAEVLTRIGRISGERLAIMTNGGGAGVLAVDRLKDLSGTLASLQPETIERLNTILPPGWSRGNPVDIIGDAGPDRYRATMDAVLADPAADAILVLNCPTAIASSTDAATAVVAAVTDAREAHRDKPVLTSWLGADAVAMGRKLLNEAGIPTFETPAAAIDGFMYLVDYQRAQAAALRLPVAVPAGQPPDRASAARIIAKALDEQRTLLNEAESKALLSAYGIPVAETRMGHNPAEVAARADEILAAHGPGTRIVVKIWSRDISHKSDVGGVRLGLLDAAEARAAAEAIIRNVARLRPEAKIDGFMVQPMIERPGSHELIVGLAEDSTFGPIVLFGAGGTGVEVINDKAIGLPPLDRPLALELIRRTRVSRLLAGYRDRPAADLGAIADTLTRVAQMAAELPEVAELDINPLLADANGVLALDARVVVQRTPPNRDRQAIRPYPADLAAAATLPSGKTVTIRPVLPEDELLYAAFFERLSADDIRARLFQPLKQLTHTFVARLTQIDYAREMAFVALDPGDGALLGVSRFIADADRERAEFAIIVRTDLHGQGLGWALMQKLIGYARDERIGIVEGHVLAANTTMLRMCRELGFAIETDPADPAIRSVWLKLPPEC